MILDFQRVTHCVSDVVLVFRTVTSCQQGKAPAKVFTSDSSNKWVILAAYHFY